MPKHEHNGDVWDRDVTCGRNVVWGTVRVEVRTAHLVHVELALPSSELSVAGCEVPDEVVAGSMNENISKYIYWKKKSGSEKWEIWAVVAENRAGGLMRETLGVIQGKISFSFHCCWVFYFWFDAEFAVNAVRPGNTLTCHLCPSRTPPPWLFCGGKASQCYSVLSNRMFFIHHKAPTRRWIVYEWLSLKFANFRSVLAFERWTQNLPGSTTGMKLKRIEKIEHVSFNRLLLAALGGNASPPLCCWDAWCGHNGNKNWHQISFIEVYRRSCARQCQISAFERFLRRNTLLKQHNY